MVQRRRTQKAGVVKRKASKKVSSVGNLSANKASFAAKLAAFVLDDHRGAVKWTEKGGFAAGQPHVFGVLPFLHLNVSESKFREMLKSGESSEANTLSKDCNAKKLNTKLSKVGFSCKGQSSIGVKALAGSTISSVTAPARWESRKNGRRVLSQLQKLMNTQVNLGIIPASSVQWCKC
jgi:hypothetical protein